MRRRCTATPKTLSQVGRGQPCPHRTSSWHAPLPFLEKNPMVQWRIPYLPRGDHGERAEREPKRGLGAEPPAGSRCRAPGGGQGRSPLKLKAFVHFYTKKWPKVKDLGENLPPCLSRATMTSPKFWSMGGGATGPPIAGSATVPEHGGGASSSCSVLAPYPCSGSVSWCLMQCPCCFHW